MVCVAVVRVHLCVYIRMYVGLCCSRNERRQPPVHHDGPKQLLASWTCATVQMADVMYFQAESPMLYTGWSRSGETRSGLGFSNDDRATRIMPQGVQVGLQARSVHLVCCVCTAGAWQLFATGRKKFIYA